MNARDKAMPQAPMRYLHVLFTLCAFLLPNMHDIVILFADDVAQVWLPLHPQQISNLELLHVKLMILVHYVVLHLGIGRSYRSPRVATNLKQAVHEGMAASSACISVRKPC